ncbi:TetR family transcriptional regulator [Breoghania corrubedonensis]|uniref:TetR family transcriptional regulator n=1 Tax=Breoghania corrubedonensis TaxID=665038 RepID=A0A2T5V7F2_9HYPH|nr:TetR/AcrR family transcriptional regulator [Breoghania corrubedonensis]PTW59677.1 TetR family transcriptional regulator [Breoghania corrubedonensis]
MDTTAPDTSTRRSPVQRPHGPGRPREYDTQAVLDAALRLFWERGYEATSVDALTAAMGLSKSSFYAAFGSKQGVLLAALQCYSDEVNAGWAALVAQADADGAMALVNALARPECGSRGCLFANMISERGPHDGEVADLGRQHFARIETLLARCLDAQNPQTAHDKARALMALAFGAMILRKSGVADDDVRHAIAQGERLITER